jgi:hypothetical protein
VGRIKSVIARKLVWPNCKHFRLLWPKSWWPPEAQPPTPQPTSTAAFSSSDVNNGATSAVNSSSSGVAAASADGHASHSSTSSAYLHAAPPPPTTPQHETTGTPLLSRSHSDTPTSGSMPDSKMSKKLKKQLEAKKSFQVLVSIIK